MKILLADDHALFRDSLVEYIKRSEPDYDIAVAEDFDQAKEILDADSDFNLVLLDLKMPGMNGLKGFETLHTIFPDIPVAMLSGLAEEQDVEEARQLGAAGYFPKTMSGQDMVDSIRSILGGDKVFTMDPETKTYKASYEHGDDLCPTDNLHLTPREQEVLAYLLEGASNKEIANALELQVVTIKLHVRGICQKLGAKNRTQAALNAKAMGIDKKIRKK